MSGATVGVGVGLGFPSQILILPSGAPVYPEPANLPAEEGSCKINAAQKLPCWSSLCQGGGEGLLELPKQAPPAQPSGPVWSGGSKCRPHGLSGYRGS